MLDFIGQSHRKFRFDLRYRAVTATSRSEVQKQIEQGVAFLPAGCTMQLDRVAKEIVLESLQSALPNQRPAMVRELRDLAQSDRFAGRAPTLSEFLEESGLDLGDVNKSGCWSDLLRKARLPAPATGPSEEDLGDAVKRLLHIDDPLRLDAYRQWLRGGDADERLVTALVHTLWGRAAPATLDEASQSMRGHPAGPDLVVCPAFVRPLSKTS